MRKKLTILLTVSIAVASLMVGLLYEAQAVSTIVYRLPINHWVGSYDPEDLYYVTRGRAIPDGRIAFPADFKGGLIMWDQDMIDIDKVWQQYDGEGVYVAVLDTGLVANWRDYFPEARIATEYGIGFVEAMKKDPKTNDWVGTGIVETTTFIGKHPHGTHVTSTIIGFSRYGQLMTGTAPRATIIPVKVLETYEQIPDTRYPPPYPPANFGTDAMVIAGIEYVTELKLTHPDWKMIISMSLGSDESSTMEQEAIDDAISAGIIVVAAAGNAGDAGMDYPGAYPEVISVGATGWIEEWTTSTWYRALDVPEDDQVAQSYVCDFSGREKVGQDLDVLAPGSWVVGPFPGAGNDPGFDHLPWWSYGKPPYLGWHPGANYYYVGGTSMATPHVSGLVALILQAKPGLTQAQIETLLESTAVYITPGSRTVLDYFPWYGGVEVTFTWNADAVGYGLVDADAAIAGALALP